MSRRMILALFGAMESKRESVVRAKKLVELYDSIRDAPDALDIRKGQVFQLQCFIDRSNKCGFDANWWDGLQRAIGDPEELLTGRDIAAMRRDKSYWKKSQWNHLCCPKGSIYRCKLHPKEIALLETYKAEVQDELDAINHNLPLLKAEVEKLCAVGSLPKDVADQYRLTEDGREKETHATDQRQHR
jgi:hypothetical protein